MPTRATRRRAAGVSLAVSLAWIAACRVERPAAGVAIGRGAAPGARTPMTAPPAAGSAPLPLEEGAGAGRPASWDQHPNIVLERNVAVRMRDGVVLRADVYRPAAPGRYPTLVYRTPYGKDGLLEDGSEPTLSRAPRAGYALVVQDVRGRFNSEGEFRPYQQEGKDGYDTVEWASAQPWSDGRVGTFGLSYPGAVQWLLAMETPPHLVSIFPAMTFATGRQFFFFGGGFNHDWMRWILLFIAPDVRVRKNLPGPRTEKEAETDWKRHRWEWESALPLRGFPVLRDVAPWYDEWLAHPDDGAYWDFADVTKAYGRMTVPALHLSAWYDSNYGPLGAIANFNGMRLRAATPQARAAQRLILGPWDHGDPTEHETRVGERDFGPNMAIDYYGLILRWHDRWLKGIRNGVDEGPPVRIFVMGENVWRDENEFPLARTRYTPYYLHGGGHANTADGDGRLSAAPPAAAPAGAVRAGAPGGGSAPEEERADHYLYDPGRPVRIDNFETMGPFDHSKIQARRDVLVYSTAPLDEDVEVTGPIRVNLWVASSAVDTDFAVMLCDVEPDGKAYNVAPMEAGFIRARYRVSEAAPEMLTPNQPTEIVISSMVTSQVFRKGHRVRLEVTSSRFPNFDRNPNTGEAFGTSERIAAAHQTIYHDAAHPSRVTLPIIPRGPAPPG
jgi:putative CocE/NonD family hydrolase